VGRKDAVESTPRLIMRPCDLVMVPYLGGHCSCIVLIVLRSVVPCFAPVVVGTIIGGCMDLSAQGVVQKNPHPAEISFS